MSDEMIEAFHSCQFVRTLKQTVQTIYIPNSLDYLKTTVSQKDFSNFVNWLIIELQIQNGHRTGVIVNMKLKDYQHRHGNVIRVSKESHLLTLSLPNNLLVQYSSVLHA